MDVVVAISWSVYTSRHGDGGREGESVVWRGPWQSMNEGWDGGVNAMEITLIAEAGQMRRTGGGRMLD